MITILIPKIVHQTWKTARLPVWSASWVRSWSRVNPDWTHWIWTDADNARLVETYYTELLTIFNNLRQPVQRSDLARYLILHRFGGVYADLDCECLRPLNELFADPANCGKSVFLGRLFENCVDCACMASIPRHPFWSEVIAELKHRQYNPDMKLKIMRRFSQIPVVRFHETVRSTGPFLLSDVLARAHSSDIMVLSEQIWFPGGIMRGPATTGAYVTHHSQSSWMHPLEKRALLLCPSLKALCAGLIIVGLVIAVIVVASG